MRTVREGTSRFDREIALVIQAYDTVIPDGAGSYLASPISTGRRLYEALAAHRCNDLSDLIASIGDDAYLDAVRWPNVFDGELLAKELRARGVKYLINPGPVHVTGWSGEDYMTLCFRLIEKKVSTLFFHPEWIYSLGAVREYLFAIERGKRVLDATGAPLRSRDVSHALTSAAAHLERMGVVGEALSLFLDPRSGLLHP